MKQLKISLVDLCADFGQSPSCAIVSRVLSTFSKQKKPAIKAGVCEALIRVLDVKSVLRKGGTPRHRGRKPRLGIDFF